MVAKRFAYTLKILAFLANVLTLIVLLILLENKTFSDSHMCRCASQCYLHRVLYTYHLKGGQSIHLYGKKYNNVILQYEIDIGITTEQL